MSFFHNCNECRTCPKCLRHSCSSALGSDKIQTNIEDGWIVKRCPHCNEIIEKFETFKLLRKSND